MNAPVDLSNTRIETDRLILRPWTEEDLNDFFEYASVDGVGEMAGWAHHESIDVTRQVLALFIKEKKTFALELKENAKVIGSLGLEEREDEMDLPSLSKGREIGYVLSRAYWGQGLMTEAVKAVMDHCFHKLRFDWLTCGHFSRNNQSRRVIEKCGFTYVKEIDYETRVGSHEPTKLYVYHNPAVTMNAPVDVSEVWLETERLILRPVCQADFPEFHQITTSPEIAAFDGWNVSQSEEETHHRLDKAIASREELAVVLKETGKMIGNFAIQGRPWDIYPIDRNKKGREFGFDLNKDYWGRGLMPEALRAVTDYCLNTLGFDFVTCGHFLGNERSVRVIQKCGFTFLFEDVRIMPSGNKQGIRTYICYKEN